jgi:transposase
MLTAGQAHDLNAAPHLLPGLKRRYVVADRGYDADAFLALIRASGAEAHIPWTRKHLVQRSVSPHIYRERNLVERFSNKLKHRRLLEPIGHIPPAEAEANVYAAQKEPAMAA